MGMDIINPAHLIINHEIDPAIIIMKDLGAGITNKTPEIIKVLRELILLGGKTNIEARTEIITIIIIIEAFKGMASRNRTIIRIIVSEETRIMEETRMNIRMKLIMQEGPKSIMATQGITATIEGNTLGEIAIVIVRPYLRVLALVRNHPTNDG